MKGPLISIVMPAYQASGTIAGAILGVVNQRYADWELVIIDDGSTDDLDTAINQFNEDRIRLVRLPVNGGLARALNLGIAESRGRYIARMDADDYMEEWRLHEQLRYMMLHDLAICGAGAEMFGVETGMIRNPRTGREILDTFLMGNPFVHPTVMFDRAKLGVSLHYDCEFLCEEDYELWGRLISKDNCGNIDCSVIKYRVSATSNANHLAKMRLKRLALRRFGERMGLLDVVPVDVIAELQIAGFIDAPGWSSLVTYARYAEAHSAPKLGWIHGALLEYGTYAGFFAWLNSRQHFLSYDVEGVV